MRTQPRSYRLPSCPHAHWAGPACKRWLYTLALACLVLASPVAALAQEANGHRPVASQLLPESVVFYAEATQPFELLEMLLRHPQRARLEALPQSQAIMESEQFLKLKAGLAVFEAGMGKRWPQVLQELTREGIALAVDSETDGVAVFSRATDSEVIDQLRETVFSLVRAGKLAGAPDDPVKTGEYRGITAYKVAPQLYVTQLDQWLVATSNGDLGKAIIDRHLEAGLPSLAASIPFAAAYSAKGQAETAWGYVAVATIRDSGAARQLYSGKTENIVAELLFGGLMPTLQFTSHASLELDVSEAAVRLTARMPHNSEWVGEERAYFFGADGIASVAAAPAIDNQLFTISLYRDLSEMWLWAGDLLTEKGSDEMARADSQLSLFFAGRDFGEDILSVFGSDLHLVGQMQEFSDSQPTPSIRLPAFALLLEMDDDEQTQADLRRVFQSFIGFLNIVGAMDGQPQLDLGMDSQPDYQLVTATYVAIGEARQAKDAAINYNFSPTLGFSGRRLILASTTELARELAQPAADSDAAGSDVGLAANSLVELNADVLRQILVANREQMVAQNMLKKGHSPQQAAEEIGVLFELLKILKSGRLALLPSREEIGLRLEIQVHAE